MSSSKPVLIIDFDDTLTALPAFWRDVIGLARTYGQRVVCMTQRNQSEHDVDDIDEWLADNGFGGKFTLAVYFTSGESKIMYIERVLRIEK